MPSGTRSCIIFTYKWRRLALVCPSHSQHSLNNPLSPFINISWISTMPRSRFFQTLGNLSVNTQIHPFSWHASTWVYSPWFSLFYSPSSATVPSSSQHHWSVSTITLLYEFAFLKQNIRGLVPARVSLLPYTWRQMLFHTSGSQRIHSEASDPSSLMRDFCVYSYFPSRAN